MAFWTLPFLWIGVGLSLRRAADAGRSPWLALLFFVPYVKFLLIVWLCLQPRAPSTGIHLRVLRHIKTLAEAPAAD